MTGIDRAHAKNGIRYVQDRYALLWQRKGGGLFGSKLANKKTAEGPLSIKRYQRTYDHFLSYFGESEGEKLS